MGSKFIFFVTQSLLGTLAPGRGHVRRKSLDDRKAEEPSSPARTSQKGSTTSGSSTPAVEAS